MQSYHRSPQAGEGRDRAANDSDVVCVGFPETQRFAPLASYPTRIPHLILAVRDRVPADQERADVVVTQGASLAGEDAAALTDFVRAGHGWLHLVQNAGTGLPAVFGVSAETLGCEAELRVLFGNPAHPIASRLPDAMYIERGARGPGAQPARTANDLDALAAREDRTVRLADAGPAEVKSSENDATHSHS